MRTLSMPGADYERRLRAKLDGSQVRLNLAKGELVLATHEFVKGQVVDQVRSFFRDPQQRTGSLPEARPRQGTGVGFPCELSMAPRHGGT